MRTLKEIKINGLASWLDIKREGGVQDNFPAFGRRTWVDNGIVNIGNMVGGV